MGKRYLVDTNAIIDFLNGKLPEAGRDLLADVEPVISIISKIELFSSANIPKEELLRLQALMEIALIYPLTDIIAENAIILRQTYRIKLPDTIIAATALTHNLVLITRNVSDFDKIKGLDVIDPHKL